MWNRPTAFIVINLAVFVPLLLAFGFEVAPPLAAAMSLFVFLYNIRFVGLFSSTCLSIIFLLVFDSEAFTFTDLNLRLWYLPLTILLLVMLGSKGISLRSSTAYFMLPVLLLFLFSTYYLFIESFTFKLHIVKYWMFSVGLIYILITFFRKHRDHPRPVLGFLLSIVAFVAIYGLIQYAFMSIGNYNLIRTTRDFRPEAFFSETTWYAELLILGFPIIFLLKAITKRKSHMLWIPLLLVGIFLSVTRNAFLGLFIFVFGEVLFHMIKAKIRIRYTRNSFILATIAFVIVLGLVVRNFDVIKSQTEKVISRFNLKEDNSSVGRMEAFSVSFKMMKETPFFGNGFYWDESVKAGIANTAVGAKSFNLLFMIYHIFGPPGFVIFLLIIVLYFYLLLRATIRSPNIFSRYAVYVFTIFFVMSMFAPIHQFPIGLFFVAFSVFLYNCGLNGKNLLHHSES